jgi:hypothetical protein
MKATVSVWKQRHIQAMRYFMSYRQNIRILTLIGEELIVKFKR